MIKKFLNSLQLIVIIVILEKVEMDSIFCVIL